MVILANQPMKCKVAGVSLLATCQQSYFSTLWFVVAEILVGGSGVAPFAFIVGVMWGHRCRWPSLFLEGRWYGHVVSDRILNSEVSRITNECRSRDLEAARMMKVCPFELR